ncbi:hypothetical protein [Novosphingobium kaempferiae]|uniref:hypothetical protein n=1 Tax=Novosphingobium kaempferiae TaxID=2896849 RepID=UPI001E6075FD|nr:hypothetical protein [Novosphingobium kaempferiae]
MANGISPRNPARWRALPRMLAGFLPVGVFGVILLWAMGEWGVFTGILAGTAFGALAAWSLTRLIAVYPMMQWAAAVVVGLLLVLITMSLF